MTITLGALAPPLSEQLKGFLDPVSIRNLQKLADSIVRLTIGAILSDSEVEKANRRLLKLMAMAIIRHADEARKAKAQ